MATAPLKGSLAAIPQTSCHSEQAKRAEESVSPNKLRKRIPRLAMLARDDKLGGALDPLLKTAAPTSMYTALFGTSVCLKEHLFCNFMPKFSIYHPKTDEYNA